MNGNGKNSKEGEHQKIQQVCHDRYCGRTQLDRLVGRTPGYGADRPESIQRLLNRKKANQHEKL